MGRIVFAVSLVCLFLARADVVAQESAKVEVTIKISDKTPGFQGNRLVVMLYHDHPNQQDRGLTGVANHVDRKFSHQLGRETLVTITLGDEVKIKPGVQYSVDVTVFDEDSKVTHVSEVNGLRGAFNVLTNGASNKVAVLLKPAQ